AKKRLPSGPARQHLAEEIHLLLEQRILLAQRLHATAGMQDRRVVAAAKAPSDLGQRACGQLARQIHRDLTGAGDAPRALRRVEIADVELVELGRLALDVLDGRLGSWRTAQADDVFDR